MSLKLKSGETFIQVFSLQSNFLASSEPQLETLKHALFCSWFLSHAAICLLQLIVKFVSFGRTNWLRNLKVLI